jgi:hypothetical protein
MKDRMGRWVRIDFYFQNISVPAALIAVRQLADFMAQQPE